MMMMMMTMIIVTTSMTESTVMTADVNSNDRRAITMTMVITIIKISRRVLIDRAIIMRITVVMIAMAVDVTMKMAIIATIMMIGNRAASRILGVIDGLVVVVVTGEGSTVVADAVHRRRGMDVNHVAEVDRENGGEVEVDHVTADAVDHLAVEVTVVGGVDRQSDVTTDNAVDHRTGEIASIVRHHQVGDNRYRQHHQCHLLVYPLDHLVDCPLDHPLACLLYLLLACHLDLSHFYHRSLQRSTWLLNQDSYKLQHQSLNLRHQFLGL